MPDAAWKAFERRIAKIFPGASRRGAYTGNGRQGRPDLVCPGYSVECKLLSRPSFADLLNAARQAEDNAETAEQLPVAVVKRKGDLDANAIVVMRLETFREWFVGQEQE